MYLYDNKYGYACPIVDSNLLIKRSISPCRKKLPWPSHVSKTNFIAGASGVTSVLVNVKKIQTLTHCTDLHVSPHRQHTDQFNCGGFHALLHQNQNVPTMFYLKQIYNVPALSSSQRTKTLSLLVYTL